MKKRILSFVAAAILALAMAPGLGASANSPEVSIEGINNGTTLEYKDSHTFVVDALQGNAQRVLLYVNGEAAGEASAYPYAITTDKIQVGINKLYAVAFDRDNEKFTSQTYNIKVTHIQSMNVLEKNDGSVVPPVTNWARYNWMQP